MRIVVITQDEPFYLAESLKHLIEIMPKHSQIVGCVVSDVSPFGKKENTFYHFAKIDYNYIKYINIEGKLIKIINSKLSNKHLFCRLIINQKKN